MARNPGGLDSEKRRENKTFARCLGHDCRALAAALIGVHFYNCKKTSTSCELYVIYLNTKSANAFFHMVQTSGFSLEAFELEVAMIAP